MPRPTIAEIDLDAIAFNMRQIRVLVGPGVRICPTVKANGYGHGAVEVGRAALGAGADMLAVATLEEALELRESGITAPILNFQCLLEEQVSEIVPHDIRTTVCCPDFASELSRQAERAGKRVKVHVKVDTGMGRVGVQKEECIDFVRRIASLPGLEIEGLFTHFPTADEDDLTFSGEQIREFREIARAVEEAGVRIPLRHMANSGAILSLPESHLDMVRPGIMLYGLYDGNTDVPLSQALTLKTRIVYLKELPPGRTVSYGRTYTTTRPTRVATIPIGYGDGYNRLLSNRVPALVRGNRVPVIGRVCMDQTMLDVTDVPGASVGDEVVLYGAQGNERISIREIASLLGTITYEVTCSLSARVQRVYR